MQKVNLVRSKQLIANRMYGAAALLLPQELPSDRDVINRKTFESVKTLVHPLCYVPGMKPNECTPTIYPISVLMLLRVDERVPEIAHLLNKGGLNLENDVVVKAFDLFTLWHLIFASHGKVVFMYEYTCGLPGT